MDSLNKKPYSKSESNISSKTSRKKHINKKNTEIHNTNTLNKNMFEFNFVIGKGGFGKVWRVKEKKTKELYALKEMSKTKIIDKKSEKSINGEREFLSYLHHPFIVNMHYAFQDHDNLYLVMDLLTGGDLRYHCSRYRSFSEEQTRFFLACIIHSLSYIHKNKVIHRDIKPENLVLDDKGYVRITDFGIAKINMPDNSSETSGTPGYMCPEVMNAKNHSFPADYFSIGVIGYEFMMGRRPYRGRGRKEIKQQMLSYQAKIEKNEIKDMWSLESVDFINKLLKRKEQERLGSKNGIKELKEHIWMKYYPWKDLSNKTLAAPFIPDKIDNYDKNYCENTDKISEETQYRYEEIMLRTHFNTAFSDFFYNKNDIKNIENNKYENSENEEEESKDEEESKESNTNNNIKSPQKDIKENISDKESESKEVKNINEQNDNNISNKNDKENINNLNNEIKERKNTKDRIINNNINNEYFKDQNKKKINIIKINKEPSIQNQLILPKTNPSKNIINKNLKNIPKANINNPIGNTDEAKKTIDNFINIKKICINCKNSVSKITNQNQNNIYNSKSLNIKNNNQFLNRKNYMSNVNNNYLRANNNPIKNILNINNNEIHNINNNNSNINIYLSINMFNKMLNNQNVYFRGRNNAQELYRQRKLDKIDRRNVINKYNGLEHNSFVHRNMNAFRNGNQLMKSNSVGMLSNKNINHGNNISFNRNIIGHNIFSNSTSKNKNYNQEYFNFLNKV